MRYFAILLLVLCPLLSVALGSSSDPEHQNIPSFAVEGISAVRALLELSRAQKVPLGVVEDDPRLCTTEVTYSAKNISISTAVQGIVAQVPGYKLRLEPNLHVYLIVPASPRPVTLQFLSFVDEHYGPLKGSPQMLLVSLWIHIRALLFPGQGIAASILESTDAKPLEVEARNETVEQILDRIAVVSRGMWILRPLPQALQKLGSDVPFSIFSEYGNSDPDSGNLCNPVQENK
jgi:hypothetical protein